MFDPADTHTVVMMGIYQTMILYYKGQLREAGAKLNGLLSLHNLQEFFHISTDIKLSLAFIYIQLKEYEMATNITRNILRKIKTDGYDKYTNIADLVKVFGNEVKQENEVATPKQKDSFTLFKARNSGDTKLMAHFISELNKKYA